MNSFKHLVILGLLCASVYCQQQQYTFDAAKLKMDTALNILSNPAEEDLLVIQAVVTAVDAIFAGNIIVLPSKASLGIQGEGLKQSFGESSNRNPFLDFERGPKGFNTTMSDIDQLITAISTRLSMMSTGQVGEIEKLVGFSSKDVLLVAMDLLAFSKEMLLTLSRYTTKCNPNTDLDLQGDFCKLFLLSDETGTVLDDVLSDMTAPLSRYFREIRSPLFAVQNSPLTNKVQSWQISGLTPGECSAIVQDFMGLKAIFRTATITLWNFPWLSSSPLLGKKAFVFEWVPAQYIKTISFCNFMNPTSQKQEIVQNVNTETVIHRSSLHLWNLLPVMTNNQ